MDRWSVTGGTEGKTAKRSGISGVAAAVIILLISTAGSALAHCDTMDVPVISQARQALETGDVKIVLPWVAADKEKGIWEAFDKEVAVRGKGPKEKTLAIRYIFEPLVRVHVEAREKQAHADKSVEAGRAYVRAYVLYLHFMERFYNDPVTPISHGAGEEGHARSASHPESHTL